MNFWRASLLSAIGAMLLLAAPASAQSNPAIGAAAPDTSTLRAIEGQVSQIRGLQALTEPELKLLDHSSLTAYLADQFERDYLPNEREADQKEFVLLGLLKPTDNLVQIQLNLLSDQVIGVYDSQTKSLFVVADQAGFGPGERMTYAHEFNHALQDQYYDLNKIAPKHPESSDRSLAVHALIEGDAIMLQTLWAQTNLTQDDLIQLARGAAGSDDSLARVPPIVRAELLRYGRNASRYLAVKPGLTGLWQVKGRSDTTYRRRVAMDKFYVRNQSILLDIYILAATPSAVLRRNGAY